MPSTTGDVYEVVLSTDFNGVVAKNVYFYQTTADGTTALEVSDTFRADVAIILRDALPTTSAISHIVVNNLFTPDDRHAQDMNLVGTFAGASQPGSPFQAWGFTLFHDEPNVRAGSKRYIGVTEGGTEDGLTSNGFTDPFMDAIGIVIADVLVTQGGIGDVIAPIVVGRILDIFGQYVLPKTLTEMIIEGYGFITEALFKGITSQVSRKLKPAS